VAIANNLDFEGQLYGQAMFQNQKNIVQKYSVRNSVQINHQPDARIFQFIILTFIYSLK
jgi:hypothetical protein